MAQPQPQTNGTSAPATSFPSSTSGELMAPQNIIQLALPKGRMQDGVLSLLRDAGINVNVPDRGYRPTINLPNYSVKLLKPQNIIEMLASGSRDVGFGGADWVANLGVEEHLVQLLDTGLDLVKVVAAGPSAEMLTSAKQSKTHLRIASEYEKLTKDWITKNQLNASFVRAFGATESFPPEDADLIVDNTATGSTLKANGLTILDTVFVSSTRLYASRHALENPVKKRALDELVVLLSSALAAREKVMCTFNISSEKLDTLLPTLPCMRAPTASQLYHGGGFAIQVVIPKKIVSSFLPQLKTQGATDIIVSPISQIIP